MQEGANPGVGDDAPKCIAKCKNCANWRGYCESFFKEERPEVWHRIGSTSRRAICPSVASRAFADWCDPEGRDRVQVTHLEDQIATRRWPSTTTHRATAYFLNSAFPYFRISVFPYFRIFLFSYFGICEYPYLRISLFPIFFISFFPFFSVFSSFSVFSIFSVFRFFVFFDFSYFCISAVPSKMTQKNGNMLKKTDVRNLLNDTTSEDEKMSPTEPVLVQRASSTPCRSAPFYVKGNGHVERHQQHQQAAESNDLADSIYRSIMEKHAIRTKLHPHVGLASPTLAGLSPYVASPGLAIPPAGLLYGPSRTYYGAPPQTSSFYGPSGSFAAAGSSVNPRRSLGRPGLEAAGIEDLCGAALGLASSAAASRAITNPASRSGALPILARSESLSSASSSSSVFLSSKQPEGGGGLVIKPGLFARELSQRRERNLERNRVAAVRSRQKRKQDIEELNQTIFLMERRHQDLVLALRAAHKYLGELNLAIQRHRSCGFPHPELTEAALLEDLKDDPVTGATTTTTTAAATNPTAT